MHEFLKVLESKVSLCKVACLLSLLYLFDHDQTSITLTESKVNVPGNILYRKHATMKNFSVVSSVCRNLKETCRKQNQAYLAMYTLCACDHA